MKGLIFKISGLMILVMYLASCAKKPLTFPESQSVVAPQVKESAAKLLWIGPDYKLAVTAKLEDTAGITKIRLKNGEWQLDTTFIVANNATYLLIDTFKVKKDVNVTQHVVELIATNSNGGVIKANVNVEDLSAQNQVSGYNPDLLPPSITVTKPTVTKFYGLTNDPITVDIDASISDQEISSIEVKVWGETAQGESVSLEDVFTPSTSADKTNYHYIKSFSLPAGKVGQYQYVVKSTDASGNKSVKGNSITVGYLDRLYLSDAETPAEVTDQGYDHYGACRGIGTLLSMKKQGANSFYADYYYRNEASDNIRFIAFLGNDKPFSSNQATILYTLDGFNVLAQSASEHGGVITDLSGADFKLPVSQKGYYRITVDMTARTVSVVPLTPDVNYNDATKYPGWSASSPWDYLAVTGTTVVGTAAWTETATSPKLVRESDHPYLYTGTFKTNGSSSNISLNAPLAVLAGDIWGKGWFRMTAARTSMRDDYNELITKVGPVGPSSGGANWGFSLSNPGTFKATYDMVLKRFRVVRIGN